MTALTYVFALGISGRIDMSATRRPSTPRTRHVGSTTVRASSGDPMRHVPTPCAVSLTVASSQSSRSRSDATSSIMAAGAREALAPSRSNHAWGRLSSMPWAIAVRAGMSCQLEETSRTVAHANEVALVRQQAELDLGMDVGIGVNEPQ